MDASATDIRSAPYGTSEVVLYSEGRDIVVISDLHLASGTNTSGNFYGTENFFADNAFERFMQHIGGQPKQTVLIINGDFIDFLRITDYPKSDHELENWQEILQAVGIDKSLQQLKESLGKKEREYGLKTNDYKSIWKLYKCANGHHKIFQQLAVWLIKGNTLIITKGNHDLEWYWPSVRKYFSHLMQKLGGSTTPSSLPLYFVDDTLIIDNKIYVRHGHTYENDTEVKGEPTINAEELNLPFGSFFNRYLINRLELAYPFLDNVRPQQKILPILIRERFPLAIKVLLHYVPFTLLIIPKKLWCHVFKYLFNIVIVLVLPLAITAYAIWKDVDFSKLGNGGFVGQQLLALGKNFGFLFLSYIFGRLLAMARLSSLPTFIPIAKEIFQNRSFIEIVTFGHSHNPEQYAENEKFYFNTGTWMPVYDLSIADVRMEKTYTYLLIQQDEGGIVRRQLLRWNDDALRADLMVLCEKK